MKPAQYLQEVIALTGFSLVPGCSPIKADPLLRHKCYGTIIGERSGYIVALSMVKIGNQSKLAIMVRYPKLSDSAMLEADLKSIPGIKSFLKTKDIKVMQDSAVLLWGYAFRPPKGSEVVETLDAILSKVPTYCSRFNGKCEDCGTNNVSGIVLYNDVPGYHCSNCQLRIADQQVIAAQNYASSPSNYTKAVSLSFLVAIGCAVMQGALLYWLSDEKGTPVKLWAVIGVLSAMAVAITFAKTIGRIDLMRHAPLVCVLSLVSMIAGDVIFFTWYVAPVAHVAPSRALAHWVIRNLVSIKTDGFLNILVSLCQIGAAALPIEILKKKRPVFTPVFRSLGTAHLIQETAQV